MYILGYCTFLRIKFIFKRCLIVKTFQYSYLFCNISSISSFSFSNNIKTSTGFFTVWICLPGPVVIFKPVAG